MAGVDDVTPHIEIEGADDAAAALAAIGAAGEEAFNKIGEAAASISQVGDVVEQAAEAGKKSLGELGIIGADAFNHILEAASNGNLVGIVTAAFGHLAGALTEVAQKTTEFIEAQAQMVETLSSLADVTGVTLGQIEGLKDAFASVGISTNAFERSFGRLAISIGNDWGQIQQSARTSADAQSSAMLHVQETAYSVQKAYHALGEAFSSAVQTAQHDSNAMEGAALGLRQAMQDLSDFSSKSAQNSLSVESAAMSLESAKRRLFKDSGGQVSAEDEKQFKIAQDKLAVQEAENRLQEAYSKKQKEGLELEQAQLKVKKAQQEVHDAEQKQIEDSVKASERIRDAQDGIDKAKLAHNEAIEKQHEQELKNISAISKEVEQVAAGYKQWDEVMNHAEITARDLGKAVILAAAGGPGSTEPPKAIAVFKEMTQLFHNMGDSADANAKKIAIVQTLMGAGFRAGQASAAQMVAVINRGDEAIDSMMTKMEGFSASINLKGAQEQLLSFNSAFSLMNTAIDVVRAKVAGALSPAFESAFAAIRQSIVEPTGALNQIGTIIGKLASDSVPMWKAIGQAIASVWDLAKDLFSALVALDGLFPHFVTWADLFKGIANVFNVMAIAVGGVTVALGGIIVAVGMLVAAWKMLPKVLGGEGKTFAEGMDNDVTKLGNAIALQGAKTAAGGIDRFTANLGNDALKTNLEKSITDGMAKQGESADKLKDSGGKLDESASDGKQAAAKLTEASAALPEAASKLTESFSSAGDNLKGAASALTDAAAAIKASLGTPKGGMAEGGKVTGPGGPTTDSAGLFALSNGEYVMRSAAVQHYGSSLFDALNGLAVGGFATGGMVGGPRAPTTSPSMGGPSSVLNLTIDGQHFNGLRAPEHVASKLKSYAVTRQASSAGKMPSWMR